MKASPSDSCPMYFVVCDLLSKEILKWAFKIGAHHFIQGSLFGI